jgi:hypothetical protein
MLARSDPARAEELQRLAQDDVDARWRLYEQLAEVDRGPDDPTDPSTIDDRQEVEDP